jgi:hypothetical protein
MSQTLTTNPFGHGMSTKACHSLTTHLSIATEKWIQDYMYPANKSTTKAPAGMLIPQQRAGDSSLHTYLCGNGLFEVCVDLLGLVPLSLLELSGYWNVRLREQ